MSAINFGNVEEVHVQGFRLHAVTEQECVDLIIDRSQHGLGGWVVTPNVDILRQCSADEQLRDLVQGADLLVADGMPLIWVSRLQGSPLPERVAGSNLIISLCGAAAEADRSVYLLGGSEGAATGAAKVLTAIHPELTIAGSHCPPMGFESDPEQWGEIEARLADVQPDIVFVALGFPKQERVIARLRTDFPHTWWLGVGVSFSFLAGQVRRAPRWAQQLGLEWVHRLSQEPRRLARRYLIDDPPFALQLLLGAFNTRLRGRAPSPHIAEPD